MIQLFDIFNHAEMPSIILCNPNKEELYSLSSVISNDKLNIRFNSLSEFTFDIPKSIDGGTTTLECYDYVKSKRLVSIENIGYFVIFSVTENMEGAFPVKKVQCRSLEGEFINKRISAFSGTYKFYDPFHIINNIIDTILDLLPSWSVGYIDPLIIDKYRTFKVTDTTAYAFLMNDVEKAFQCVFSFDTDAKTISAYSVTSATSSTDIFLSFENLVKNANLKEISDEIVTALYVYGGNDLSIRSVNPLGGNILYNFDYYKTTEWMSQGLIDAIDAWEAAIAAAQPTYASDLADLKIANEELIDLIYNATTGLNKLLTDLSALEALQQAAVIAVPPDPVEIADIAEDISDKESEIVLKRDDIATKETEIDALLISLQSISSSLSFDNYFTESEYEELSSFIYENTYANETIIVTDSMTPAEEQDAAQELYDQGEEVLTKVSQPRYEFEINTANFIFLKEYLQFTAQLELGSEIIVDFDDYTVTTVLLEIQMSFNNPEDFKLTFSNRLRLDNGDFQYSDILGQVQNTATTVNLNELTWDDWPENYKDTVSTFITSSLNATTNNIVNSSNQEMIMNAYGLRGRKLVSPGIYDDKEMWLTNNVLAFTTDSWTTSSIALGTIETDNGTFSGLVADTIVGRLLAGNSLLITNDSGTEVSTFSLDQNGAVLVNSDFTIENSVSKIVLDPDIGILIQKKTMSGPIDVMYLDVNGNAVFAGQLSAATGSFSGSISATTGNIGNWTITATGLENADAACNLKVNPDDSSDCRLGNFVSTRNSDGTDSGINFTGENAEINAEDVTTVRGGNELNLYTDVNLSIACSDLYINTNLAVTGTIDVSSTPNLVFTNGILTGYS